MRKSSNQCRPTRRAVLTGASMALASAAFPDIAAAATEPPRRPEFSPPLDNREDFVQWMELNRGEQPPLLTDRWRRYLALRSNRDLWGPRGTAFLLTPREQFVLAQDMIRAYDNSYLDIGYGATISGPGIVARMTSALEVSAGDRVLEIGTGSGYQSAYLANLTDQVWTVEIVGELVERARSRRDRLIELGYREYAAISGRQGNGYFGWAEAAPFDKIVVTCAVDHVPQPLLDQLKPGGTMILPLGPRPLQHVVKVVGAGAASRPETTDIFHGKSIRFLPMRTWQVSTLSRLAGPLLRADLVVEQRGRFAEFGDFVRRQVAAGDAAGQRDQRLETHVVDLRVGVGRGEGGAVRVERIGAVFGLVERQEMTIRAE